MNYTETLKKAKEHNIDIIKLDVAYEVECCYENGTNEPRYEDICKAVYKLYMKTEGLSINQICLALKDGIKNEGCTLDDVLNYGNSWDMVIDLACQCTY